jgi:hypothetical protein
MSSARGRPSRREPYRVSQIIAALEQDAADAHPSGTLSQLVMIDGIRC